MGGGRTLLCDSRQQRGKHTNKERFFESHGIKTETVALPFGDYMVEGSNISVDTKQSIDEVARNVGHDHRRFVDECERAREAGYRLVVLVERGPKYNDRSQIDTWRPFPCRKPACSWVEMPCKLRCGKCPRKPMQGPQLRKTIETIEREHGARFMFCTRNDSPRIICELLGLEVDGGK